MGRFQRGVEAKKNGEVSTGTHSLDPLPQGGEVGVST